MVEDEYFGDGEDALKKWMYCVRWSMLADAEYMCSSLPAMEEGEKEADFLNVDAGNRTYMYVAQWLAQALTSFPLLQNPEKIPQEVDKRILHARTFVCACNTCLSKEK